MSYSCLFAVGGVALDIERQVSIHTYVECHFDSLMANRGSDWNTSIYDLAWVMCTDFFPADQHRSHLSQILEQQNADGTWGTASYMSHSALVDTLATLMMLTRLGRPIPRQPQVINSVSRLLQEAIEDPPVHDTVAFELIMPLLWRWLEQHGVNFDLPERVTAHLEMILIKGERKLQMMDQGPGWFSESSSLSFTAEFAVLTAIDDEQVRQLGAATLANGAVGLSPAATAATILLLQERGFPVPSGLYDYLNDAYRAYENKGFPNLYPSTQTQRLWNVLPWLLSGSYVDFLQHPPTRRQILELYQSVQFDDLGRVSWDWNNAALPDLDDTAVAYALYCALVGAGVSGLKPRTADPFSHFRRADGSFYCYPYELHPSPVGELHALLALDISTASLGPNEMTEEFKCQILHDLNPAGCDMEQLWHDKWHASWTYGAQRWLSIPSIRQTYPDTVREMVDVILLREQNGGWGQKEPTAEETAYIASGLCTLLKSRDIELPRFMVAQIHKALTRSQEFLAAAWPDDVDALPRIWISKNLYNPKHQIISAMLDASYNLMCLDGMN